MEEDYPDRRLESGCRAVQKEPVCPECGIKIDCTLCDKSLIFKNWHRTIQPESNRLRDRLYHLDADLIEWRYPDKHSDPVPVGVLELTRNDRIRSPEIFYKKILRRYTKGLQGSAARRIARALDCDAYIVVFHEGMKAFRIYYFAEERWTNLLDIYRMESFIKALPFVKEFLPK